MQAGLSICRAYPRELIGSRKMRVSGARAGPPIRNFMLMDEPFAELDESTAPAHNRLLVAVPPLRKTVISHPFGVRVGLSGRSRWGDGRTAGTARRRDSYRCAMSVGEEFQPRPNTTLLQRDFARADAVASGRRGS